MVCSIAQENTVKIITNPYNDYIDKSPRKYCFEATLPIYTIKNLTKQTCKLTKAFKSTYFEAKRTLY